MTKFKLYKTTYESDWNGYPCELEVFSDGNWQITWIDIEPLDCSLKHVEEFVYNEYVKIYGK